jgi:hypothetical protein
MFENSSLWDYQGCEVNVDNHPQDYMASQSTGPQSTKFNYVSRRASNYDKYFILAGGTRPTLTASVW